MKNHIAEELPARKFAPAAAGSAPVDKRNKKDKQKVLLYKEILSCTEPPSVQDNIPYTLMPFQFSRYQHRFFSTRPTFPIVMTTEQTNSLFRECTTIRALSSLYPKSVFGPPGRREPARACLCYHSGGGEVSESLMPWPVQVC